MRRLLAQTLAIQSLGIITTLGTTLLIARLGGAGVQGHYALVKSINDLQVAVCSFGLPLGLVYMLNKTGKGHRAALKYSMRYAALLLFLLPLINVFILHGLYAEQSWEHVGVQAVLIGFASALLTGYSLQRGIVLSRTDGAVFSWLSVLPTIVIAVVAAALLSVTVWTFELAYLAAGIIGIAATAFFLNRSLRSPLEIPESPMHWPMLWQQSVQVFSQSVFLGLQVFLSNAWLESQDPTLAANGLFNISSMVITIPNLLVALVAPVLFNQWSRSLQVGQVKSILRNCMLLAGLAQLLAVLLLPAVPFVLGLVFGAEFKLATPSTCILLGSIFAVVSGRILTPALQGLGFNWLVTISCFARLATIVVVHGTLNYNGYAALKSLSFAWVVGEYAALVVLVTYGLWSRTPTSDQADAQFPAPQG